MTREQTQLLYLAALAFNMGIGARSDRDPESVAQLDEALRAYRSLFDLQFEETA